MTDARGNFQEQDQRSIAQPTKVFNSVKQTCKRDCFYSLHQFSLLIDTKYSECWDYLL
jgi:hypothetical protein